MKKISLLFSFILIIHSNISFSQFTWQQLNGPQGGLTTEIKSNSNGTLFMGSLGGGIHRSTDNGLTWDQKVNGFPSPEYDDGTVAIAVAGDGDIFASSFTDGVFRSTNNGESWINTNLPHAFIVTIVIDQNKRVYCGNPGGSGVYVTSNNGLNWLQKNNGLPVPAQISSLCLTAAGELYAGTYSGSNTAIYRSTDYAESWTAANLTNANPDNIVSHGSAVFAAAYTLGVFRTTNSGQNWQLVNNGLSNKKINRLFAGSSGVYAATDSGLFRSTNNGDNWFIIGFAYNRVLEVFMQGSGTLLAAVSLEGIYRSGNNGVNWIRSSNGFNCNPVISISVSGNTIYTGLEHNGLMRSTDSGNNWAKITNGFKGSTCGLVYTAPNGYVYVQSDSGFFRSTNSGNNWVMLWGAFSSFTSIVSTQSGYLFASATYPSSGVWRSTNNGTSWDMPDPNFQSSVYSLCITQTGTLFAGSSGGGVYRSTNNGLNWIQSQPAGTVHSLTITPNGNIFAHFYVSSGQTGIYRSTNNGVNWQYVNFGNNDYYFLKSNSAGHIFAGGFYGAGLYRSTNNGNNWQQIDNGIYNRMIAALAFDNAGFGYVGSYYGGIYKTNISTIGLINISAEIPGEFKLSQNYPNPFNPVTNIEFDVPKSSFVKLTVYDVKGRAVETLVNSELSPGTYKTDWNAANFSSGVYFYRLQVQGYIETKKMLLIK